MNYFIIFKTIFNTPNFTEFSGQRLKEGGHINKSLVTLGSVISALAEASKAIANQSKQVSFLNKMS